MTDYLGRLGEREVAAFYRRFALDIATRFGNDSLAASLLLHWLDGGGRTNVFPAQDLRNLGELRAYLRNTARAILLSTKPLASGAVDGIVPRIRGTIKSNPPGGPYAIRLETNIDTDLSTRAKANQGMIVAEGELNALYALDGWTIVSEVILSATPAALPQQYDVKFERWICQARGAYVWTPDKHMTVPNPDHGLSGSSAVSPGEKEITIFNKNAIRVENAGMANPFVFESDPWEEIDLAVVGPATVQV